MFIQLSHVVGDEGSPYMEMQPAPLSDFWGAPLFSGAGLKLLLRLDAKVFMNDFRKSRTVGGDSPERRASLDRVPAVSDDAGPSWRPALEGRPGSERKN
jgi:hypothetical protein